MASGIFPKASRLLTKTDFRGLWKNSLKVETRWLRAYVKKRQAQESRLGIGITKKVGKAVRRNRLKRIIREYFRTSDYRLKGWDILVTVNPKLSQNIPESFKADGEIRKSLNILFKKIEV